MNSLSGSRTPLSRGQSMTGACTNRYTNRELIFHRLPVLMIISASLVVCCSCHLPYTVQRLTVTISTVAYAQHEPRRR